MDVQILRPQHCITLDEDEAEALIKFLEELSVTNVEQVAKKAFLNPYFMLNVFIKITNCLYESGISI